MCGGFLYGHVLHAHGSIWRKKRLFPVFFEKGVKGPDNLWIVFPQVYPFTSRPSAAAESAAWNDGMWRRVAVKETTTLMLMICARELIQFRNGLLHGHAL